MPTTDPPKTDGPILSVRDLHVAYKTGDGKTVEAVRGVDFDLYPNQSLALVGESGCGKTTLGLGLLRLLPKLGSVPKGSITFNGRDGSSVDVLALRKQELRKWRWRDAAMVFQGAMNSFNPVLRIIDQMGDTIRAHPDGGRKPSKKEIWERSAELLRSVRLEPNRVLPSYPHELSGGMRQRVLIAMSLLLDPKLLILDEPTTALDILTQRAIVDVLHELRAERKFAMVFISHDLAIAAELADRVATMYAGKIIEAGTARDIFYGPRHPYTVGLIKAVPPVVGDLPELASIPGAPPSLSNLPSGCSFAPRCEFAEDRCTERDPELDAITERSAGTTHAAACLRWEDVTYERKVVERV
ncbi:ABC transporter ATP-binding protein [Phytomonospora endophytica]|uniref:Peptide/nickel transport system ATP-binding protein n=1 Tax=Phytomonospora endophytica TaxID=714109 RepID=A0A841FMR7_9ACTN|nr:ABC transporter ATP-binding protein [Phytomonospora endophytica]MBB6037315.1 peptide/nickel transport system ATP-binding protein [Phytomonospora endophytica]GIG69941.1 ABC transporter ATP-binding protein [Phytomonospora endophytica]